ncbi:MAG: LuxR C-terminal-related transcriptional regulator [Thermoleophilia bacterium]
MSTLAAPPIIETKLRPPDRRAGLVARDRLMDRLDSAVRDHSLTLVSAAAGWGKSSLLGTWIAGSGRPTAWVALDAADNDPARYWGYATEALRRAGVPVDAQAAAALAGAGDMRDAGMSAVLNAMATGSPVVIALDDYHAITNDAIHEAMAFLVERLPDTARVVMTTRTDPPIGLSRLRARGGLGEIRSDELRFDDTEAAALLNEGIGLALGGDAVERLRSRTEGWAAGLYLAGLSLRGRVDAEAFIAEFAGDDRLVVDYLADEVLAAQPPERREFLLTTAILGRLCGPLCEAVTGVPGAARTLVELEASNLFLVPLDNRREWYRYHHLFGELLRHELSMSAGADEVAALHARAAAWHREHGDADEAVHHTIAAGDIDGAADLIAATWAGFHQSGWTATTQRWLSLLPPERVLADPRLCIAEALILVNLGRHDEAEPWLDRMEEAMAAPGAPGDTASLRASLEAGRAFVACLGGDAPSGVRHGRAAVEIDAESGTWWSAIAYLALGIALQATGESEEARPALERAVEVGMRTGSVPPVVVSLSHLSSQALDRGEDAEGEALARRGIEAAELDRHAEYPHAAGAHSSLARALARRGAHEEALAEGERGVLLARRGRARPETAHSILGLAEVHALAGRAGAARASLDEARELLDGAQPVQFGRAVDRVEAAIAAGPVPTPASAPGPVSAPAPAAPPAPAPAPAPGTEALTDRELAVLRRLTGDGTMREIAADLYVSHNTVKTQIRAVYRKLGVATRDEAVRRARELGLLPGSPTPG